MGFRYRLTLYLYCRVKIGQSGNCRSVFGFGLCRWLVCGRLRGFALYIENDRESTVNYPLFICFIPFKVYRMVLGFHKRMLRVCSIIRIYIFARLYRDRAGVISGSRVLSYIAYCKAAADKAVCFFGMGVVGSAMYLYSVITNDSGYIISSRLGRLGVRVFSNEVNCSALIAGCCPSFVEGPNCWISVGFLWPANDLIAGIDVSSIRRCLNITYGYTVVIIGSITMRLWVLAHKLSFFAGSVIITNIKFIANVKHRKSYIDFVSGIQRR